MKSLRSAKYKLFRLFFRPTVLHCIGDSHVRNFEYLARECLLLRTDLRFCIVQGATNLGLANPHSQTQAMPVFMDYRDRVASTDYAVFCLGEVDCGFVIWYRSDKHGTSVQKQFEISLTNYFGLVDAYLEKLPPSNMIICSTPLPTIPDHQLVKGEVANKRLSISATQKERTALTIEYNGRLNDFCEMRGIHYIDLQQEILDKQTGVVSKDFLNNNPLDHHLEPRKSAPIITTKLNRIGLF